MLTTEELSATTGIKLRNIMYFVTMNPRNHEFFHKEYVQHLEKSRGNKMRYRKRAMWCIEDDKVDAFVKLYEAYTRSPKPKISNGKTGADRLAWTTMARECYAVKCRCSKCNNNKTCSEIEKITHERKMKKTVIELVKELGLPPERIM